MKRKSEILDVKAEVGDRAGDLMIERAGKDLTSASNSRHRHNNRNSDNGQSLSKKRRRSRSKKFQAKLTMYFRRIHLFSGLFMFPWVMLYGFTALLFNHPTYMTDSKTEIEHFSLTETELQSLSPLASEMASAAVAAATEQLNASKVDQIIQLPESSAAMFSRQFIGTVENEEMNSSVRLNFDNGIGYLRNRQKETASQIVKDKDSRKEGARLEDELDLTLPKDPVAAFRKSVTRILQEHKLDPNALSLRSVPNLEFDAMVDGELKRLRLSQRRSSRGSSRQAGVANPASDEEGDLESSYESKLTIVGLSPRALSPRSFLLRLHMAHGYGVQANARWFWAIAVDLMFASMCFWGISGIVMWWQIKRTRKIGLALLIVSAVVATYLAIGMHWQIVNG